jgi:UDP-2-acetamido-3-amino-2,3-dideoxy-glucuronate N-acetyltransferase
MYKLNISVVGCGAWGKNLVRNFSELGVLGSVCDPHQELGKALSSQYQVPFLTFDQVLESSVEGVVIAAPAIQHYMLAKQALHAGKHVFVEKPLSLHVHEAQELCFLAQDRGCTLMVGHLLQYHPAFLELKKRVSQGHLGRLQYIYSNRLNLGKFRHEENILWSFAPHDISMILALVGEQPETVYATGASHLNPHIHDVTTTHLSFKKEIEAHVFVSWLHPFKEQKLVVVGDKGMMVFDDGLASTEKLRLYPHTVSWVAGLPEPEKAEGINIPVQSSEPLTLECQHFLDCMVQNTQPRTDGFEGLRVLHVLEAAQKSLYAKFPVSLNTTVSSYFLHETAVVDAGAYIGQGTKIWHFSHILKGVKIGKDCTIGQNVMVGPDVVIGDRSKIQNNVSLYKGVILEEGVFCGPSCVFTNVNRPRAEIKRSNEFEETYVEKGVSIGANATIICGVRLGAYSFIGAGAVVTKDVKAHALMVGHPARQVGWVSHAGERLGADLVCPREKRHYQITEDNHLLEIVYVGIKEETR